MVPCGISKCFASLMRLGAGFGLRSNTRRNHLLKKPLEFAACFNNAKLPSDLNEPLGLLFVSLLRLYVSGPGGLVMMKTPEPGRIPSDPKVVRWDGRRSQSSTETAGRRPDSPHNERRDAGLTHLTMSGR